MREARDTTMTVKGQVTIPVEVRRALGLQPHDRVQFEYDDERKLAVLRPAESAILRIYGSVQPRQRPEDFRALREEFEQAVSDEAQGEA